MENELPYRRSIFENDFRNYSTKLKNSNDLDLVEKNSQEILKRYYQVSVFLVFYVVLPLKKIIFFFLQQIFNFLHFLKCLRLLDRTPNNSNDFILHVLESCKRMCL